MPHPQFYTEHFRETVAESSLPAAMTQLERDGWTCIEYENAEKEVGNEPGYIVTAEREVCSYCSNGDRILDLEEQLRLLRAKKK